PRGARRHYAGGDRAGLAISVGRRVRRAGPPVASLTSREAGVSTEAFDAVVIGAGHNGLVAANLLADEGWSVLVLEATAHPGGAVRTAEVTEPGFRNDLFSAFYPMSAVSPAIRGLRLEEHGL